MPKLYLSLGSNLGDRRANIEAALDLLDTYLGTPREAVSSLVETAAQGFSGPDFLNCAARYECSLGPFAVLGICKRIEGELGRIQCVEYAPDGSRIYHSRPIDIDIILYGDLYMDTSMLKIPHPRMKERDFVMVPLGQIFERND